MDTSTAEENGLRRHRFRRAVDCDDLYFKYSISICFTLKEVQSMFRNGTAQLVKKPPGNSLVSKLKMSDKIAYIKYVPLVDPTPVLCSNIAACRKCKEVFYYSTRRNILRFCRSHICQMQSDVIINTSRSPASCSSVRNINTCEPPGNIGENPSDLQDVNGSDMILCSINTCKPPGNTYENISNLQGINRNYSSICSINMRESPGNIVENTSDLQDVNRSDTIICSINTCKPPGNTSRYISDVNSSGLRTCSINMCESPGSTSENITNLEDVNNRDMVVCTCQPLGNTDENIFNGNTDENVSNLQDINRNVSSICSINACELPGNIVENTSDLQDVNGSHTIICSINTCKPPGNTSRYISDVNSSGLRTCSINTRESPGNTCENITSLADVNNSDMAVCTCQSLGNTDENISNLQDINRSGSSICSIRQEDDIETDLQNCENNDSEEIVGNTEEYMHSTENIVQLDYSTQDENMELNVTDESIEEIPNIPVTESVHEETANDNRSNSKNIEGMTVRDVALIGLRDSTENIVQLDYSTQDENMELNTTLNVTDESIEEIPNIPVTESVHEGTANDNRSNSKNIEGMTVRDVALIGLRDKLDNPFESVVVTDLYNYNLIITMNEFYKTGRFTDASVVCENQKIECHRLVLSMFSAHFEEVFRECYTNHAAVAIEGLKFWQVKALIDYMYTTEVKVEDKDWTLLMEAADKLQFRDYLRPSKLPRNSAKKRLRL